MSRTSIVLSLALLLSPLTSAKNKNKSVLPAYVLQAQTVMVVIDPDAGEPLANPNTNRIAQDDVETALQKWGRFSIALDSQTADLVIVVRKGPGQAVSPSIRGGPIDNQPVILEPGSGGDIRIGGHQGHPPNLTQAGDAGPQRTSPRVGAEVGPSEDMLEVYRGGVEYPLDSPPIWRYMAKDALRPPAVPGIEQFRKAIDEAEKAAAQKQPKHKP